MLISEVFKKIIKEDIINLVESEFNVTSKRKVYISTGSFFSLFIKAYPLKYQRNDRLIITSKCLVDVIKGMNICSKFKFKRKNIKRYKFLIHKINEYKK